ncbi:MAG: 16S rRNA (guanine(527)-N(7))-methyltransferase RsmG [Phycisphaerales bacterium]|nr:16S rRNA (guanine(527)-N(7))-methyltransferase RsmG [Planctomycetota bacterium]MCH8507291.1 16S rRNA (guanine(527)-N(7))-methyltransferase RsmG [Phycisphaerales bacterium]
MQPLVPPDGWIERVGALGVSFAPGEVERLGLYLALLLEANTRMNLTAIRDAEEAWEKHIFDALTIVPVLADLPDGAEVVDVGTGGGIPGLVLACVMPRAWFTLVDATGKKCDFVREAAGRIGLSNVVVLQERAERLGQDRGDKTGTGRVGGHRGRYDAVVSRAVGRLVTLLELTVPLAKVGGLIVLTKGQKAGEELAEAKQALHMLHAAHAGTVETPTGRLVVIEKLRDTPKAYPRGDGEPKKAPLGVGRN